MTKVVILCGGQGTRIRDVADNIPKPMIPVGDQPILLHIMKLYAHYGVQDFVLCLGYKGWVIKEFFLNYRAMMSDVTLHLGQSGAIDIKYHTSGLQYDWNITLAETGHDTQTAGRLWRVRKYLEQSDLFCVTYGDGVADIDINALIQYHKAHGRIGTVTGVRPPGRFGVIEMQRADSVSLVSRFIEKPQTLEGIINGGFFVFDQRFWSYLRDDDSMILEQEPLSRLAEDGELALFEHSGFWQPMDTYREWKLLNELWAADRAPWKR